MANGIKYQSHEILNKVLNSAETGLQVDIVAGAEYAEDSGHSSTDTGNFVLGVRNDTLAALGGTDGDYVPFQMNASGALFVEVASASGDDSIYVDDADWTNSSSKHTLVGGLYQSSPQSITDGDTGPLQVNANGNLIVDLSATDNAVLDTIAASLSVLDDWDDSNYANVNVNIAGTDFVGGAGSVAGGVQRVTLASDDPGVAKLGEIETTNNANQVLLGTIDSDTDAIKTAVEKIDNSIFADNAGFTLTTSSVNVAGGVYQSGTPGTLGDNDAGAVLLNSTSGQMVELMASTATTEVVGDAAEDDAAAGNPVLSGGRYDSPGNDNATVRSLDDNDVGALALDPTGALYVREYLGQTGSCFVSGTAAVTAAIGKFVAIQFLEDTVFNSTAGLVATDSGRWPDDTDAAADISSSNTAAVGSQVFPQGMTIFGRWSGFKLASGAVIGYIGYI